MLYLFRDTFRFLCGNPWWALPFCSCSAYACCALLDCLYLSFQGVMLFVHWDLLCNEYLCLTNSMGPILGSQPQRNMPTS